MKRDLCADCRHCPNSSSENFIWQSHIAALSRAHEPLFNATGRLSGKISYETSTAHGKRYVLIFRQPRVKREQHYQLLNAGALFDDAIENLVS